MTTTTTTTTTITLEVRDEDEGEAIKRAMEKPDVRAFVVIVGALLPFSKRMQGSILNFANDMLADKEERAKAKLSEHARLCAKHLSGVDAPCTCEVENNTAMVEERTR